MRNIKTYILPGILIVLFVACLIGLKGATDAELEKEETYGTDVSTTSNGSDTLYAKDGVIVSLQSIYHNDNFIALQVMMQNESPSSLTLFARIESLDQSLTLTVPSQKTYRKYLIIGDSRASSYDMEISVTSNRILASGTVHVQQDMAKATVFTQNEVLYFGDGFEMYYLGTYDNTGFFRIVNNTGKVQQASMNAGSLSFVLEAKEGVSYPCAAGLGTIKIAADTFQITLSDIVSERESNE